MATSSVPAGRSATIQLDQPRVSTVLSRGRPAKNSTPVFSQVCSSARSMMPAWSYWLAKLPRTRTEMSRSAGSSSP